MEHTAQAIEILPACKTLSQTITDLILNLENLGEGRERVWNFAFQNLCESCISPFFLFFFHHLHLSSPLQSNPSITSHVSSFFLYSYFICFTVQSRSFARLSCLLFIFLILSISVLFHYFFYFFTCKINLPSLSSVLVNS